MADSDLPLLYKRPRPLRAGLDHALSLATDKGFGFAAGVNSVPLVAAETQVACKFFPILFADLAFPQPVALLGLRADENLFVEADGQWAAGTYIPGYVRRYPFILMENRDRGEYTLCIDEAADSIVEGESNRFFDDLGQTELTRNALAFCMDYQNRHAATVEFARALSEADLLVQNRADITLKSGVKLSLAGFKVIDEARFNALPAEQVVAWRDRGWLSFIYCHFVSMTNWAALVERVAARPAA
jgi:hypothetical protein